MNICCIDYLFYSTANRFAETHIIMRRSFITFCIVAVVANFVCAQSPNPVVKTPEFEVTGLAYHDENTGELISHAFLSVPYAQPPVGDLRLEVSSQNSACDNVCNCNYNCESVAPIVTVFLRFSILELFHLIPRGVSMDRSYLLDVLNRKTSPDTISLLPKTACFSTWWHLQSLRRMATDIQC